MAEFRAGSFSVDVTPTPGAIQAGKVWLAGFALRTSPATSVQHPIFARAIAIEDAAGTRFAILTLDVCGVQQDFTDRVRARVAGLGLSADQVFVNSSHTHCGPTSRSFPVINPTGRAEPDPAYMQQLEDSSVSAIQNAVGSLTDADIFFGRGDTNIGHNRHTPGGEYDAKLDILHAKNAATGSDIAVVFFHGCHPVSHGPSTALSPDFVGETRDQIEARLSAGADALFVQGFAGTIDPAPDVPDIPAKLAADVVDAMKGVTVQLGGLIHTRRSAVGLPLTGVPSQQHLAATIANPGGPSPGESDAAIRWAHLISDGINRGGLPASVATEIQTVKIGTGNTGWRLVASAHEVVTEWSDRVRKLWEEPNVSLAGYTGSVDCYLPTAAIVNETAASVLPEFVNYEGCLSCMYYGLPSKFDSAFVDALYLSALQALDPA